MIKKTKHIKKEESVLTRVSKEQDEIKKQKEQKEKQKELDIIAEKELAIKLIVLNLVSLDKQLTEKNLWVFWVFPDRSGFKKIKETFDKMQKFIYQDVDKYKNRKICKFSIIDYYKDPKKFRDPSHYWLVVNMITYPIDDTGNLIGKHANYSCTYAWKDNDFKTTKLTFKLLETIMHPIVEKKHKCASIFGIPITVIKHLEKKGINFSDALSPLAGL
jgi:hypothetical protein